ncbi:MAG: hypothetical protein ACTHNK_07950, partial [Thermomicrobiales bacterium]
PIVCTLPAHTDAGMIAKLTVKSRRCGCGRRALEVARRYWQVGHGIEIPCWARWSVDEVYFADCEPPAQGYYQPIHPQSAERTSFTR